MKAQTSMAGRILLILLATGGGAAAQDTLNTRIYFAYNSHMLETPAIQRLDSLLTVVGSCPVRQLRITGNTDQKGSAEYNLQLSERRAAAVVEYLASRGVAADHLEVLSQGKSLPLVYGEDEASMAANRRVDVEMILWEENLPLERAESVLAVRKPAGLQKFPGDIRVHYPETTATEDALPVPRIIGNVLEMLKLRFITMSTGGEVLAPVAIIRWKRQEARDPGRENDFLEPLTVMVPVRKGSCSPGTVKLWKMVSTDTSRVIWEESTDSVEIVKMNTGMVYSFRAGSAETVALMCRPQTKTLRFLVKDLTPGKLLLVYSRAKVIVSGTEVLPGFIEIPVPDLEEVPKLYASASTDCGEAYEIKGMKLSECRRMLFSGEYILKKQDFRKRSPVRLKSVNRDEVIFGMVTY